MYKLIKLLFVLLLTAGFSIIGCSSDDNPAGTNGNGDTQHDQALVATWNLTGYIVGGVPQDSPDITVTLNADGTGLYVEHSASGTSGSDDETSTFHWSTAGGTQLTIVHDDNNETDVYGYVVQGDGLSLSWIEDNLSHIYTFEKEYGGGGSAVVHGTVHDYDTGDPINEATVSSDDGHSTSTDTVGQYSITVGVGNIEFTASKSGYYSRSESLYLNDGDDTMLNFELVPESGNTGRVSGHVKDSQTDEALADVQVSADDGSVTTTDAVGDYSFDVRAGNRTFSAYLSGYEPAQDAFEVVAGGRHTLDFELTSTGGGDTGTIYGDVADEDSNPLENVLITADDANYTMTDQNGHYSFTITEGSRTLVATLLNYEREIHSIEVVAGQSYEWSFTMTESGAGFGTVYGDVTDSESNPLQYVMIVADDYHYGFTDQDGHYSFSVTAGNRGLEASLDGYNTETVTLYIVAGGNHEWSFTMTETGGSSNAVFSIELHWNVVDNDLDIHLLTPEIEGNEYHVYYGEMGSEDSPPYARLLQDHYEGPGPEIIEIYQLFEGTYRVYSYDNTASFEGTDAKILFKDADGNIVETVFVTNATRQGDNNDYWHVANFDGATRAITVVNQLSDSEPEFYQGETPKKPK